MDRNKSVLSTNQSPSIKISVAALIAALCLALAGCATRGMLVGARDNTSFAQDDSLQLVVIDPQGSAEVAVVRTLRGEHVRTIYAGERGLGDTDDRGLRFVGRDHFGWFRGVAGQGIDRFRSGPYARIALNGPGTRIAAIGRQFEVVSFDTGDILVQKNCPRAVSSCSWVAWDLEDPDVVWLATGDGGYVRWNFQTDETARFARDPHLPIRYPPESAYSWPEVSCRGGDAKLIITRDTIDLVENGQQPRRVVTVKGSSPGLLWFRERRAPLTGAMFLEGCRYVIFSYRLEEYLLELATGSIGKISGIPIRTVRVAE